MQEKRYLHVGQKMLYLNIFGLEFEKAIVIFEINALKFGQIATFSTQ